MQQDGARLTKLKEVFKRAIQEVLKEEESVRTFLASPQSRDSFYSDSTVQITSEDIKGIFTQIKSRFSEILKAKIRKLNLDFKLNNLDKDIKDARLSYKDIKNLDYIKEIFESNIVDKKESFVKLLEEKIEEPELENLKNTIEELKEKLKQLENENENFEAEYLKIIEEMEGACNE